MRWFQIQCLPTVKTDFVQILYRQLPMTHTVSTTGNQKYRHARLFGLKELLKRIVIIPVENTDKQCACGKKKAVIRYEIK